MIDFTNEECVALQYTVEKMIQNKTVEPGNLDIREINFLTNIWLKLDAEANIEQSGINPAKAEEIAEDLQQARPRRGRRKKAEA